MLPESDDPESRLSITWSRKRIFIYRQFSQTEDGDGFETLEPATVTWIRVITTQTENRSFIADFVRILPNEVNEVNEVRSEQSAVEINIRRSHDSSVTHDFGRRRTWQDGNLLARFSCNEAVQPPS